METTLIYAAVLGLLMALLSIRVPMRRASKNLPWGDGGDEVLSTRIRVFGNFIEYVPMILLLMALLESLGLAPYWIHVAGLLLVVSRIFHAVSLKAGECPIWRKVGRGIGSMGTWILLVALSIKALTMLI